MPLHARTYCLARKLDLEHLVKYASVKLGLAIQESPPSPDMWAATVREIYTNTAEDDKVRELVITGALRNLNRLLEDKDSAFSTMMLELGGFGRDIARIARYASDFQDSDFNPLLNDSDGHDKMLTFHCEYCDVHWKSYEAYLLGDECILPCPRVECSKMLKPFVDQSLTLLHRWECGSCSGSSVWCSDQDDIERRWRCAACDDINYEY